MQHNDMQGSRSATAAPHRSCRNKAGAMPVVKSKCFCMWSKWLHTPFGLAQTTFLFYANLKKNPLFRTHLFHTPPNPIRNYIHMNEHTYELTYTCVIHIPFVTNGYPTKHIMCVCSHKIVCLWKIWFPRVFAVFSFQQHRSKFENVVCVLCF